MINIRERFLPKIENSARTSGPKLTPELLLGFENEYQLKLPQEFKDFYLEFNGVFFSQGNFYFTQIDDDGQLKGKTLISLGKLYPLVPSGLSAETAFIIEPGHYPGSPCQADGPCEEEDKPFHLWAEKHKEYSLWEDWDPIKKTMFLHIGSCSIGDLLIGIHPSNFGKVYYWMFGITIDKYLPIFINDSFFEFLDGLYYDEFG